MKEDFLIPQKAVIRKGKRYLVLLRSPDSYSYPGHWDFPGGKIEPGEDPKESLEREVLEETCLKVEARKPVFTFHEIVKGNNVFFVIYECKLISEIDVRLSHEHTDFAWLTKEQILKLKTENFLRAFLEKI